MKKLLDVFLRLVLAAGLSLLVMNAQAIEDVKISTSETEIPSFDDEESLEDIQALPNINTISQEEMDKLIAEDMKNGTVIYDSSWGDVKPDWSGVQTPDDVYIEEVDDAEKYGTLILSAGVHEDIMSVAKSILVTVKDSEGNETTHGLSFLNGYTSSFNTIAGNYTIISITPVGYEDEYDVRLDNYSFTITENAPTNIHFNIAPVKAEIEEIKVEEPVIEKKNHSLRNLLIAIAGVTVVAAIALIIIKKRNDRIN